MVPEALPAQFKTVVGVRTPRGKGKPAQNGHMDVRITPGDMLPMREVETLRLQGRPQFQQSRDTAHLLQDEQTRVGFSSFIILPSSFSQYAASGRSVIKIIFNIVGGDAKGCCRGKCSVFRLLHSSFFLLHLLGYDFLHLRRGQLFNGMFNFSDAAHGRNLARDGSKRQDPNLSGELMQPCRGRLNGDRSRLGCHSARPRVEHGRQGKTRPLQLNREGAVHSVRGGHALAPSCSNFHHS